MRTIAKKKLFSFTPKELVNNYLFVDLIWSGLRKPRQFGVFLTTEELVYRIIAVSYKGRTTKADSLRMIETIGNGFVVFDGKTLIAATKIICEKIDS